MTVYLAQKTLLASQKDSVLKKTGSAVRCFWHKTPFYALGLMGRSATSLKLIPTDPWPGDTAHGRLLLDGKFMVDRTILSFNTLWSPAALEPYQQARLHTFDWLRDLRAIGDNTSRRLARQLIVHWADQKHSTRASVAWRPDIIGCRIANWFSLYDFFCASADEKFQQIFFKSLSRQVRHLANVWHLAPTPLGQFYAIYGLIFAYACLDGAPQRLNKLYPVLDNLLKQQILPDGGHSSRSPTIQLMMLRMLIDLRTLIRCVDNTQKIESIHNAITKMAPLVRLFRHGDGGLSGFDGHPPFSANLIDMILSLADVRGKPPARASSMGYERCVSKAGLLLFNAAPTLSIPLPQSIEVGTGILNFEWSLGRDRLITTGDLVLQTKDQTFVQSHPEDPALFVRRKTHDRHVFIESTYHRSDQSFRHRRQLYLDGDVCDLRGEDQIDVTTNMLFAIRFIFAQNLLPSLDHQRKTLTIRLPDGRVIRGSFSGADELELVTLPDLEDAACLLVMGHAVPHHMRTIKWAFRDI